MLSQHGAEFNHDPWADDYDRDVQNETHPIRKGYGRLLAWTAAQARIQPHDDVVDLGAGTGNTTRLLGSAHGITCVDISARMLDLARRKLGGRREVSFVQADLLGFFAQGGVTCDVLVSTYAVHHLTAAEKAALLEATANCLRPGGRAVFGDLMVRDVAAERELVAYYHRLGAGDTVAALEEEFFWRVDETLAVLATVDLTLTAIRKFSALSWGIALSKPSTRGGRP